MGKNLSRVARLDDAGKTRDSSLQIAALISLWDNTKSIHEHPGPLYRITEFIERGDEDIENTFLSPSDTVRPMLQKSDGYRPLHLFISLSPS
jgi:putative NADH-flavin reductase